MLTPPPSPQNTAMEDDGLDNVDAGHIMANRLGGPGNAPANIFPQVMHYNRGSYASREGGIYDCIVGGTRSAELTWTFAYNDTGCTQPNGVEYGVKYTGLVSSDCEDGVVHFDNYYFPVPKGGEEEEVLKGDPEDHQA